MTDDEKDESGGERIFRLTEAEHEILVKVCKRYRASLPSYLQSGKREQDLIDSVLKKLS